MANVIVCKLWDSATCQIGREFSNDTQVFGAAPIPPARGSRQQRDLIVHWNNKALWVRCLKVPSEEELAGRGVPVTVEGAIQAHLREFSLACADGVLLALALFDLLWRHSVKGRE